MSGKNVIIFWGKYKGTEEDPFSFLGRYAPYYFKFFELIMAGANLYIVQGLDNWKDGLVFTDARLLTTDGLSTSRVTVTADAVFDRSSNLAYPPQSTLTDSKVLNCLAMKRLAKDKWETYEKIGSFMANSRLAQDAQEFKACLLTLDQEIKYVVKPRFGLKGKGIYIATPLELLKKEIIFPVIIQDFLDTSGGIPNVTPGVHDLRVAVVDQKISYIALRVPPEGKLLSNVGQGGTEIELKESDIPESVISRLKEIIGTFAKEYNSPFYSIDFGIVADNQPYIFEINSQIGFPEPGLYENELLEDIANLLIKKANL